MIPYVMEVSELVRLLLVISILVPGTYTDIRHRVLWGRDRYYIMVGATGAFLFLVVEGGWADPMGLLCMVFGLTVLFILARLQRASGSGDHFVTGVVAVVLPVYDGVYFVNILVIGGAYLFTGAAAVGYNLMLNISQVVQSRVFAGATSGFADDDDDDDNDDDDDGGSSRTHARLFAAYPTANILQRMCCLFAAHSKRSWERFVVPVRGDGHGSFTLWGTSAVGADFTQYVANGRMVMVGFPIIPFFLASVLVTCLVLPWVIDAVYAVYVVAAAQTHD